MICPILVLSLSVAFGIRFLASSNSRRLRGPLLAPSFSAAREQVSCRRTHAIQSLLHRVGGVRVLDMSGFAWVPPLWRLPLSPGPFEV